MIFSPCQQLNNFFLLMPTQRKFLHLILTRFYIAMKSALKSIEVNEQMYNNK